VRKAQKILTPKVYRTATAFKTALDARIRKQKTFYDIQIFRQQLVFDRFLVRVFAELGNRIMLKGGIALLHRLEGARTTKDIDFRLVGPTDDLLDRLKAAGSRNLNDYFSFKVERDPNRPELIGEGLKYGGYRFAVEASLDDKIYGFPFHIDVGIADPVVGEAELVESSRFFEFAGIQPSSFRIYPRETHLAEKLHAYTKPRPTPNSRVKDLPDMALLAQLGPLQLGRVRKALRKTFEHASTHRIPLALADPPANWQKEYEALVAEFNLPWKTLSEAITAVRIFFAPALGEEPGEDYQWEPTGWVWTRPTLKE
jgi:hypothetical protein